MKLSAKIAVRVETHEHAQLCDLYGWWLDELVRATGGKALVDIAPRARSFARFQRFVLQTGIEALQRARNGASIGGRL